MGIIPYYQIPVVNLGPIPIDPWATLVCIGFITGMEIARSRGIRQGLDTRDIVDGTVFSVGMGFLVGHLVHVLAYHPEQYQEEGILSLLKVWGGFSSMGGFLGALLGVIIFYKWIRRRPFWLHSDTIVYGFPFGWLFGRMGCASVHDHIGRQTDFFFAMNIPGMGSRFELGLIEAVLIIPICILFYVLGRRIRTPGFFTALWCVIYGPIRFFLDFLRNVDLGNADVRYLGLTPGQYGSLLLTGAGLALVLKIRNNPPPMPTDTKNPPPVELDQPPSPVTA